MSRTLSDFASDWPADLGLATPLPPFIRRQGRNRQRMNLVANERAQRLVDQLMPGEQTFSVEFRGND